MNVDHVREPRSNDVLRQHQHVPRQDDEIDGQRIQQGSKLSFLFRSPVTLGSDRELHELLSIHGADLLCIRVIGDHCLHVDGKVVEMRPAEEVAQTMQMLGYEDCGSGSVRQRTESMVKPELPRNHGESLLEIIEIHSVGRSELHALKEHAILGIGVLLGIDDVAPDGSNPTGNTGNDSRSVAT